MYHYVRPRDASGLDFLPIDTFRQQLDFFLAEFGVLGREDVDALACGEMRPGVLLSFDDGLSDAVTHILPELVSRGISAMFYVCSDTFTDARLLPVHMTHLLLSRTLPSEALAEVRSAISPADLKAIDDAIAFNAYNRFKEDSSKKLLKRLVNYGMNQEKFRLPLLEAVQSVTGQSESELAAEWYLSRADLMTLVEKGQNIGSHTCSHRLLSRLAQREVRGEVVESKATLESLLGLPVDHFCFPYGGKTSYTSGVLEEVQNAGYRTGLSVEQRAIGPADLDERFELPRFDCIYFR